MAEPQVRRVHVVPRVLVGLGYVVAGLLVLLAQIEDVTVNWSVVAPTAVMLLGLGLLVTAVVDAVTRGGHRP
jgi:hypothetical protein